MGWTNRLLGIVLREKSFGQRRKFGQAGGNFRLWGPERFFSVVPNIECTCALYGRTKLYWLKKYMMYRSLVIFLAVCATLLIPETVVSVPAFPGAEGFGAQSIGGRGGKVLFVTNLNDSGPGSLRAAVETAGPRTVIFRVSGTVALKSAIDITKPHIAIAGQTAPGDGICLKNYSLVIAADHIIVRHIRCRAGDNAKAESDSLSVSSGRDIIVDHCSASWSVDETLSASSRGRHARCLGKTARFGSR